MGRRWPRRPAILALWSRLPVPMDGSAMSDATRTRVVDAMASTMLATDAKRPMWRRPSVRWGLVAAAAGAVALVVAGGWLRPSSVQGDTVVGRLYMQSGTSHAVVRGRELAAPSPVSSALALASDSQIATDPASTSRLQLVSGVEVVVGPETRLALPDMKRACQTCEELVLELGLIRVRVPKLPRGHSFAIQTPNALVSVHGTAFSVEVTKSGQSDVPRTKVAVTEGVVTVLHGDLEVLLDAGAEWTSSVANAPTARSERSSADPTRGSPASLGPRSTPRASREGSRAGLVVVDAGGYGLEGKPGTTDLANQNQLFSDAMHARDLGDRARAAALLDELVRRYPASPLTQDAYVARFRMLSQSGDHLGAARAARSYLDLYAGGFAAEEARAVAFGFTAPP